MRIAIAVAAAIAATSVSFAVATAANRPAPVAQTSATDKAVVGQLKTLNRSVNMLNRAIGSSPYNGFRGELREMLGSSEYLGMRSQLRKIEKLIGDACRAVAADSSRYVSCL